MPWDEALGSVAADPIRPFVRGAGASPAVQGKDGRSAGACSRLENRGSRAATLQ